MSSSSSKVVLVTGANKGLGYHVVKLLSEQHPDWTIILACRDRKKGEAAINSLRSSSNSNSNNNNIYLLELDVTSSASITSAVEEVKKKWTKIDYFIQNAGISGIDLGYNYEASVTVMATNFYAIQNLLEAFTSILQPESWTIIVSSEVGSWSLAALPKQTAKILDDIPSLTKDKLQELSKDYLNSWNKAAKYQWSDPEATYGCYGMSKVFLNSYVRLLVHQQPQKKIVLVCPGYCATDLNHNSGTRAPTVGAKSIIYPLDHLDEIEPGQFYQDGTKHSFLSTRPHVA